MFGHQDDKSQDSTHIPDQSIDGAITGDTQQGNDWGHPGQPLDDQHQSPATQTVTPAAPADNTTHVTPVDTNELLDIKQQALGQLSPLVSHLDQSPEEKFRTLMMMIQASDDQSKLQEAYKAAQAITDEKGRAQALLDVVNEINYFTQSHDG